MSKRDLEDNSSEKAKRRGDSKLRNHLDKENKKMVRIRNLVSLELKLATSRARAKRRTTPAAFPFDINIPSSLCVIVTSQPRNPMIRTDVVGNESCKLWEMPM
ncbi:unnamed protein product [Linum trigynum]|uniref:Uncharacterized protein n=1 Tax=Linum trigynum TaxID=586398 RepID=A0AAV2FLI9_9ROSI